MNIEEIGLRIASARKQMQYTQKQLADILSVSDKAVSKWERGVGCPDVSLLIPLSEALHMSVEELISGQKEMSDEQHKKTIQEIILYTKKVTLEHSQSILKAIYLIVSVSLLMACGIVLITEYFLTNTFTWSLVAFVACIYAWIIISTLYFTKENRIIKTVIVSCVGVFGLLYTISQAFFTTSWFVSAAIPMAICGGIYALIITHIWLKTRINLYYKLAITILLAIPVTVLANIVGDTYDIFMTINIFTNVLITCILFIVGKYKQNKENGE